MKTNEQLIEHLKSEVKRVKIQRNDYEQRLGVALVKIQELELKYKIKTLPFLKAFGHTFKRYLFDNEYAEEMKCTKCSYIIWPCENEEEVKEAMISIADEVINCKS